jgi:hypothetical protein
VLVLPIRYVVGRVERHLLRGPTVDGWLAEESEMQPQRVSCALKKLPGGRLGLASAGADVLAITPEGAAALAGDGALTVLIGWPEEIFVVRRGGAVLYAEGDLVHFGDLALDTQRVLRRVGFDYVSETGAEVRPHMQLEERSAIDPNRALRRLGFEASADRGPNAPVPPRLPDAPVLDTIRLAPGQHVRFGPYGLTNERSFDHERRTVAGQRGHGYFFRLTRVSEELVGTRPEGLPEPLDVPSAEHLIAVARAARLLETDEVLAGETTLLAERLAFYEGARGALEQELSAVGPNPPRLRWRGDVLEAHAGRIARGPDGAPIVGRAVIALAPAGPPQITRTSVRTLPGRLRRAPTSPR